MVLCSVFGLMVFGFVFGFGVVWFGSCWLVILFFGVLMSMFWVYVFSVFFVLVFGIVLGVLFV